MLMPKPDYEEMMLQISDVMREANRLRPILSHEQAVKNIRGIVERHGKWIGDTDYESCQGNYEAYKCSECGYGIGWRKHHQLMCQDKIPEEYREYYCPHCGARMDL